jgi:hypothetical protein
MLKNYSFSHTSGSGDFLGCGPFESPERKCTHCDFQQLTLPVGAGHTVMGCAFSCHNGCAF